MPEQGVITQNPRNFAVQIRHSTKNHTVGTGVAVNMAGVIVTCAHVVKMAGVNPRDVNGATLPVYFAQARAGEQKERTARIAGYFPQHDDDVVLLQLDGAPPLGPEQMPRIGAAGKSDGNPFRSYGYRPLDAYPASWAEGRIQGCVECPPNLNLQAEPVQLRSQEIAPGMSGAPVLDQTRNLVIGIISETYFPSKEEGERNRDTAWAVDARVLTFDPLNLPVQDAPLPKQTAPQPPPLDPRVALLRPTDRLDLHGAPPVLDEWVGRDDLLKQLDDDWANPNTHVTTLIGFGGEGKSSLARQWVENVQRQTSNVKRQEPSGGQPSAVSGQSGGQPSAVGGLSGGQPSAVGGQIPPDAIFWWNFYDDPSAESFFEAALAFMSGGQIDPRRVPSAAAKSHLIAGLLAGGRYLFVLDGFEVMQHSEGDAYGLVKSGDLRAFLEYAAAPGHESFCLITSRAPVLDLLPYTTATQRDVTRLSEADGRALLRAVGVQGPDADLDGVVRAWDGHALTLSLLGTYLAEHRQGDIAHLHDIPEPTADEPRYERVHRVLRRYDEHLTDPEREFLTLFSAFRTPVGMDAFNRVFRPAFFTAEHAEGAENLQKNSAASASSAVKSSPLPLQTMDDAAFGAMVARLTQYRLLRHIAQNDTYTTHPLVRAHYYARFTQGADAADAHTAIKDYYLELAGDTPTTPTLDDLRPLIEVVHHACKAGAYDEAFNIYYERIDQRDRWVLTNMGAWETDVALMLEFFPASDAGAGIPQVSNPKDKSWILNEIGLCLMNLGRLREATPFYERSRAMDMELQDWRNASHCYMNLVVCQGSYSL